MDEIQRWTHTSPGMIEQSCGSWVEYRTLLAAYEHKNAALAAQAEEHKKILVINERDWEAALEAQAEVHRAVLEIRYRKLDLLKSQHAQELADARGEGEPERLEYIARDLARLLLVSARADITEFRMNKSTYAWLVERANA